MRRHVWKNNNNAQEVSTQYIFDKHSKQTGVYMSNEALEEFLEDLEELFFAQLADAFFQNETEFISHDEVKRILGEGS